MKPSASLAHVLSMFVVINGGQRDQSLNGANARSFDLPAATTDRFALRPSPPGLAHIHMSEYTRGRRFRRGFLPGATFNAALALEAKIMKKVGVPTTDWFDLYIGQPLEQEARAVQAAAEVSSLIGSGAARPNFDAQLPNTEI